MLTLGDDRTREELTDALASLSIEAGRLPRHFVERKAMLHAQIDQLLTLLELLDD